MKDDACASLLRFFIPLPSIRFGEALRILQEELDFKNFYAFNPSFDKPVSCPASDCACENNPQ